jgi:hypothetical protein
MLNALRHHLQLSKNSVDTGDADVLAGLLLGVDDLAVVDDHGVASGAGT